MFRVLKTLLLWLIIVALPAQGVAAVIKSSCGPRHHSLMAVASLGVYHHDHDAGSHHHNAIPAHVTLDDVAPDTSASSDSLSTAKSSYCSACAACCVGAVAPPAASLWVPANIRPERIVLSPESGVVSFIPSGLERPPKRIPA
jgi:hypothetical protein